MVLARVDKSYPLQSMSAERGGLLGPARWIAPVHCPEMDPLRPRAGSRIRHNLKACSQLPQRSRVYAWFSPSLPLSLCLSLADEIFIAFEVSNFEGTQSGRPKVHRADAWRSS